MNKSRNASKSSNTHRCYVIFDKTRLATLQVTVDLMHKAVDIGFLEEKEGWLLHPRFFPSKIGGKPAWLDLKNLPNPKELTCKKCNDPLLFLCQVYAPFEEKKDCFHRTIFVFMCKNGSCCQSNCADNFVVLRCQLERKNDFYSYEPYEENMNEEFPMGNYPKLCYLCGTKAPSHCSKCKKTYYCSRKHQILDWQNGHKEICSNLQQGITLDSSDFLVTEKAKSILIKEWELIVDEEDEEEVTNVDTSKEMDKLAKLLEEKKGGSLNNIDDNELEQYTSALPKDKVFNKFNKRIMRHPDQVLRYHRGGSPLWITKHQNNELVHVPNCKYCDGEMEFEFQIMPQLLNFINVGLEVNSIDWGVLAIYTCKNSCNIGPAYKEEHLIKQDIS